MDVIVWSESKEVNAATGAVQLENLVISDGDSAVCVLIPNGIIDSDLFLARLNQAMCTLKLGRLERKDSASVA